MQIHLNVCEIQLNQTLKNSEKIKNSVSMEETVDGHLWSDVEFLSFSEFFDVSLNRISSGFK